jgi:predicted nuclease of predicted toxin-antitoxin system
MTPPQERLFIALYTDEDITDRLAQLLRERGFEAACVLDEGTVGLTDEEQLAYATQRSWALLTYNRDDFLRLERRWSHAGMQHAGIVISRQFSRDELGELLRQVLRLLDRVPAEEMWNTVRNLQSYR